MYSHNYNLPYFLLCPQIIYNLSTGKNTHILNQACHKKVPQTVWLKTPELHCSLVVLEAKNKKPRHRQGHAPSEICRGVTLYCLF